MKKITIALVLCLIMVGSAFAQDYFSVDVSKLPARSDKITPAPRGGSGYGWYQITFPEGTFPADLPWAEYDRIRVVIKYFRANGNEIRQGQGMCMTVLLYDPNGPKEENDMGPGPNTPFKIFNVGGANGNIKVSSEAGAPMKPLTKAPGGILLQRQGSQTVSAFELIELTFWKSSTPNPPMRAQ